MPKKRVGEETVPVTGDGQPARDDENKVDYTAPADTPSNTPEPWGGMFDRPTVMRTSYRTDLIEGALLTAYASVSGAVKDGANTHFGSKYASLASVIEACKVALTDAGVLLLQPAAGLVDGTVQVETMLRHGGQWMSATTCAPIAKNDPQAVASAVTYLRRIGLSSLLAIPQVDDDGNAASAPGATAPSGLAGLPLGRQASGPVIEPVTAEETALYLSIIAAAEAQLNLTQLRADLMKRFGGVKENIPVEIRDAWAAKNKVLATNGGAKP